MLRMTDKTHRILSITALVVSVILAVGVRAVFHACNPAVTVISLLILAEAVVEVPDIIKRRKGK